MTGALYDRAVALLDQLSTYTFAGRNETTIRDNRIVPLLGPLGGAGFWVPALEANVSGRTVASWTVTVGVDE